MKAGAEKEKEGEAKNDSVLKELNEAKETLQKEVQKLNVTKQELQK